MNKRLSIQLFVKPNKDKIFLRITKDNIEVKSVELTLQTAISLRNSLNHFIDRVQAMDLPETGEEGYHFSTDP